MNVDPKFEPIDTEKVLANLERSDGVSDQPSLELKELHESIKTKTKQIDTLKNDLLRKLTDNLDLNKRQDIVAKECADAAEKCENHTNAVMHCATLLVKNSYNKFMVDSDLIERRLGIKIKFTQRNEVKHLWEMRVMFNPTEDTSDKYAVLMYDDFYESFKLKSMKPQPKHFAEIAKFLDQTNDVNGFLYNCWRLFSVNRPPSESTLRMAETVLA